ncbi:hypothetical protein HZB07_03355 [Candidatus Saganbacteria bacterium]|nr:hypothetical protein [Candidatus Saganbacteria bacterium]
MKKFLVVSCWLLVGWLSIMCFADVPKLLSYQGKLWEASGAAVTGTRNFIFKIYSAETGGSALWTETQNLSLEGGVFTAQLGSVTAFPVGLTFTVPYWIGVTIVPDMTEMIPRKAISAAPYALNAERLGGVSATDFALRSAVNASLESLSARIGTIPSGTTPSTSDGNFNNIYLPTTTAVSGAIYLGGIRYLHGYSDNSFLGLNAGNFTMTGINNVAMGKGNLAFNTTGFSNVAMGAYALNQNITGNENVAVGGASLFSNQGGEDNVAVGIRSMYGNRTGHWNVAMGILSLYNNSEGQGNVALGTSALYDNITGSQNVAIGSNAGLNSTGSYNVFIGQAAQSRYRLIDNVVAIGARTRAAGNSTAIGYSAKAIGDNSVALGANVEATQPNTIILGTGQAVGIGTNTPSASLEVNGGIKFGGDDTASPTVNKAGTIRYRVIGNASFVDICMQTGATSYEWVNIATRSW